MKALEVKDKLIEYIMPYLEPKGFKYKKRNSTEFQIVRKRKNGNLDRIGGGFTNYNPTYILSIGLSMVHKDIIDILYKVNEKISLGAVLKKDMKTFGFGFKEYHGTKELNWSEEFSTEEGLRKQVDGFIEYLENGALQATDKYQDLREVDRIFNNLDDMWDPVHSRIGYSLGMGDLTRIITAKLSGNPNYDKVVKIQTEMNDVEKQKSTYPQDFERANQQIEVLVEILKDIKPLYDSYE